MHIVSIRGQNLITIIVITIFRVIDVEAHAASNHLGCQHTTTTHNHVVMAMVTMAMHHHHVVSCVRVGCMVSRASPSWRHSLLVSTGEVVSRVCGRRQVKFQGRLIKVCYSSPSDQGILRTASNELTNRRESTREENVKLSLPVIKLK